MHNRYALHADGHRWWWTTATAGIATSAAIATLVAIPASADTRAPDGRGTEPIPAVGQHRDGQDPAWCPSLPSVAAVGAPWAARVPGCPRLSRWWLYVGATDVAADETDVAALVAMRKQHMAQYYVDHALELGLGR